MILIVIVFQIRSYNPRMWGIGILVGIIAYRLSEEIHSRKYNRRMPK